MICRKCKNPGIRNEVLGKEFYYCRTCKEEITLEFKEEEMSQEMLDQLFDDWQKNPAAQFTVDNSQCYTKDASYVNITWAGKGHTTDCNCKDCDDIVQELQWVLGKQLSFENEILFCTELWQFLEIHDREHMAYMYLTPDSVNENVRAREYNLLSLAMVQLITEDYSCDRQLMEVLYNLRLSFFTEEFA
jgi:hypothetical protein